MGKENTAAAAGKPSAKTTKTTKTTKAAAPAKKAGTAKTAGKTTGKTRTPSKAKAPSAREQLRRELTEKLLNQFSVQPEEATYEQMYNAAWHWCCVTGCVPAGVEFIHHTHEQKPNRCTT